LSFIFYSPYIGFAVWRYKSQLFQLWLNFTNTIVSRSSFFNTKLLWNLKNGFTRRTASIFNGSIAVWFIRIFCNEHFLLDDDRVGIIVVHLSVDWRAYPEISYLTELKLWQHECIRSACSLQSLVYRLSPPAFRWSITVINIVISAVTWASYTKSRSSAKKNYTATHCTKPLIRRTLIVRRAFDLYIFSTKLHAVGYD
jgi:hypothetical protein